MMNKTCDLCGVIFHNDDTICETCRQMMAGENNIPKPVFESNSVQTNVVQPAFQQTFNQTFQPTQPENPFQSNYAGNDNFQSNHQPNQSFPPPRNTSQNFSPPPQRYVPKPFESEYKPSIWNWITDLPGFAKVGLIVLIFSICFAIALKGFTKMDVTIQPADQQVANLEPQKPWFSGWFRSKPTADEIFDKFETVSNVKGKNVGLQSLLITGKGEYLQVGPDPGTDLAALKKGVKPTVTVAPNPNKPQELPQVKTQITSQSSDFDVKFEVSMKTPNKKLTKMTETPNALGYKKDFFIYPTSGFDGTKGWKFTKSVINGVTDISDQAYMNAGFLMNPTSDGVTLTFLHSMFSKIELIGEVVVANRRCYTIKATDLAGENSNLFFDVETGLINKVSQSNSDVYILDYQNLDGILLPSKIAYQAGKQWLVLTTENMQKDVPLDDAIFRRTAYLEFTKANKLR